MASLTVACVQLRSGLDRGKNLVETSRWIRTARERGAALVVTPEMTNLVDVNPKRLMNAVTFEEQTEELRDFCTLAGELGIWLLLGSLALKVAERRALNRSFLIDPRGAIVARYDKLHMFDVDLEGGESYRESSVYERGDEGIVVAIPNATLGLSICYDLRFPHLYRALAQAGADLIAVPAAFTRQTGELHWHTLLRARAIETGAFVLAAAQGGHHEDGRETFGHSLVVAPSGQVVVEKEDDEPGLIVADLDLEHSAVARRRIPNLALQVPFTIRQITADV